MNRNVLLVDDDTRLLDGVSRRFESEFCLEVANSGADGLAMLKRGTPYAVVVSDMRMPEMNGLEFIRKARRKHPDTVYMMLTGNQDLTTAVDAVNQGQVFRFLNKPCPSRELKAAIEDGIRQHDLVAGRKELLHQTFCGSVKLLTEILELSHPELFSRTPSVERLLEQLMQNQGCEDRWEYKLAVRLANIGCIVGADTAPHPGTPIKTVCSTEEAEVGMRLLRNIPRLKSVAEVVGKCASAQGEIPETRTDEKDIASAGATLVRIAFEIDGRIRQGLDPKEAIGEVIQLMPNLSEDVVLALHRLDVTGSESEANRREVKIDAKDLREGMVISQNVQVSDGSLLLSAGRRLTQVIIEKLRRIDGQRQLRPIYIYDMNLKPEPASA